MSTFKKNVIFITDGDDVASRVIQEVARDFGAGSITGTSGNPTLTGEQMIDQLLVSEHDLVLVMVDDHGNIGYGDGERALLHVAGHPWVHVLGVIAVASNTEHVRGTHIDLAVDSGGNVVCSSVNKDGERELSSGLRVYGDTVDILDHLSIPIIIGVGDIGKMKGKDDIHYGAPITKKAVEIILERSGFYDIKHGQGQ